jgi:ubiquinone biosynthesis monooxygenase Coq7
MITIDRLIIEFDKGLRTVLAGAQTVRPFPDRDCSEAALDAAEKHHAAALMRVNHCGEVCAQALYNGQALTARNPDISATLRQASEEETEHLAWCEKRIHELGGRKSLLNPAWYAGSFALGALAGTLGDKWNLGFLAETENQVGRHLQSHLEQLPSQDGKSRAILEKMKEDEDRHAGTALAYGGAEMPTPVKVLMQLSSKAMTRIAYFL